MFCLVSGQSCLPSALDEGQGPDIVSLMERMEPSQAQAALWVLTNVFDEVAKINLNSLQKYVPTTSLHARLFSSGLT